MKQPPALSRETAVANLLQVAHDLRDPDGGCPWDLKQTHRSLLKHLIEEAYETADAIENFDPQKPDSVEELRKELGDLLFQVVIHCQLAKEEGLFTFEEVALQMAEKLIYRHPHVYGEDVKVSGSEEVLRNWEQLKLKERQHKEDKSVLSGIPRNLPALLKAYRMGEKAGKLNFDWKHDPEGIRGVREKIQEELAELAAELPHDAATFREWPEEKKAAAEEELGDVLFAVAQYARLYGMDPERALNRSCAKFAVRFRAMEAECRERLDRGDIPTLEEWTEIYYRIKKEVG